MKEIATCFALVVATVLLVSCASFFDRVSPNVVKAVDKYCALGDGTRGDISADVNTRLARDGHKINIDCGDAIIIDD